MKSATQKAHEVCAKLNLPEGGHAFNIIQLALMEQDRDTRHACAEATLGAADPHQACLNVRVA